jgi:hypothetical protein
MGPKIFEKKYTPEADVKRCISLTHATYLLPRDRS